MPALARTTRSIAYDLRGHGQSDRPKRGYALRDHLGDLEAVCERFCDPEDALTLVGHSYGALIALDFALAHPERVRRLVLIELPLPPSQAGLVPGGQVSAARQAQAGQPDSPSTGSSWSAEALLALLPEGAKFQLLAGGRRGTRFLEKLRSLVQDTDLLASLAEERGPDDDALQSMRVETLLVYGRNSSCLSTGKKLEALLPDATLQILEGGHFLPAETPGALSDTITRWLISTSQSRPSKRGSGLPPSPGSDHA